MFISVIWNWPIVHWSAKRCSITHYLLNSCLSKSSNVGVLKQKTPFPCLFYEIDSLTQLSLPTISPPIDPGKWTQKSCLPDTLCLLEGVRIAFRVQFRLTNYLNLKYNWKYGKWVNYKLIFFLCTVSLKLSS